MTLPKLAVAQSGFGGRGYRNPVTGDKRTVPSITTVLKAESKDALVQWAVDQTAGYAVANAASLLGKSEDYGFKMLRWYYKREAPIEGAGVDLHSWHEGVRDDAADMGTAIHEWIQADTVPALQYPDLSNQGEPFWQMVEMWEEFKKGKEIEPYYTEHTVWHDELGYAGTFDGVWRINDKYCLMDIKSSRGLYSSTWMQLSALYSAPEVFIEDAENDRYTSLRDWQLPVNEIGVLHIRPQDWDNRGREMNPFCKWVSLPQAEVPVHFKSFQGLLQYKNAQRELQLMQKEAAK